MAEAYQKGQTEDSVCRQCIHYDYDETGESEGCQADLDEDEMLHFLQKRTARCPYYRFYDEYLSVRRQN